VLAAHLNRLRPCLLFPQDRDKLLLGSSLNRRRFIVRPPTRVGILLKSGGVSGAQVGVVRPAESATRIVFPSGRRAAQLAAPILAAVVVGKALSPRPRVSPKGSFRSLSQ
jgi:hypothetical protein